MSEQVQDGSGLWNSLSTQRLDYRTRLLMLLDLSQRDDSRDFDSDQDESCDTLRGALAEKGRYPASKAVVEFAIAFCLLVLTSPLLVVAAVLTKLTSRGPVIYSQVRLGRYGIPYTIYKIRSMVHQCEQQTGPRWSTSGDPAHHASGVVLAYYASGRAAPIVERPARGDELGWTAAGTAGIHPLSGPRHSSLSRTLTRATRSNRLGTSPASRGYRCAQCATQVGLRPLLRTAHESLVRRAHHFVHPSQSARGFVSGLRAPCFGCRAVWP